MKDHETILIDLITHINIESTILFLGSRSPINGMEKLFSQRWSCVYTTSRNPELIESFQHNAKRRVADIVSTEDAKFIDNNSRELSIVRIFGLEDDSRDELEQEEILQTFLEKMPVLLETYGRIIFDGLDLEIDGPVIQQIYRQLAKIKRKKFAFFFGVSDQVENPYIRRLAQNEVATLLTETIFNLFQRIENNENYIDILQLDDVRNDNSFFYSRGKPVHMDSELDKQLLLNVESFAQLLNYNTVEHSDLFPAELTGQYFQSFLQHSTIGMPKWYGYREQNDFHIKRYFEDELYEQTIIALRSAGDKERREKPIMLCGQACSGKTNALGALAYRIFHEKQYPVIYIADSDVQFAEESENTGEGTVKKRSEYFKQLDELLKQIDTKSAIPNPTLIIWDTACRVRSDLNKARDLLNLLRSRGRRVQIICTAYQRTTADDERKQYNCIDVEIDLRGEEEQLVRDLLVEKAGFRPKDADNMIRHYSAASMNFIGSLYLFQDLHRNLRARLRRENDGHVEDMSQQFSKVSKEVAEDALNTVMREKIAAIMGKLEKSLTLTISDTAEIVTEEIKKIDNNLKKLVCCIAVCTVYKEHMPLPLAMRLLGAYSLDTSKILKLILGNALIREIETVEGSVLLIRSQLEANLLLKEYEWDTFELIVAMLHHVSSGSLREQRLIQGIIRTIGPNNKESNQSLWKQDSSFPKFMLLVEELRRYREQSENRNSDLILTEIMLAREISKDLRWNRTEDERISFLSEMYEIAEREIKRRQGEKMNRFLSNLYVEWANLSIRLYDFDDTLVKSELYANVKERMDLVIQHYPEDNYAYTAYLWAGLQYAESLDDIKDKLCLLEVLDHYKAMMAAEDNRDGNIFGRLDALVDGLYFNEDRFQKSIEEENSYGIHYRARKLIGVGDNALRFNELLTDANKIENCKQIIDLMEDLRHCQIVLESASCLYILINAMWLWNNRTPVIPVDEETRTSMKPSEWERMYDLCSRYLELSKVRPPRMVYLLALCCAQLENRRGHECDQLFEELRKGTSYEKRRLHILCDSEGEPLSFTGSIDGRYNRIQHRGYVNLRNAGFQEAIYFRAELIGRTEDSLKEREKLSNLNLATSFSGLQACLVKGGA
ncbi:hypothetical protein AV654_05095 [Paenibacillus elgii]|uniref:Uncharacterized protein n=1 Tax=Paenibacillus elgii TaxID=189691 RepID=A0A165PL85_9BACL|nr:hypothetical protein [Paenibacillus elgii]KZE71586.1 hypothetical protein AV654_05095 [Paenibacillus elgii]